MVCSLLGSSMFLLMCLFIIAPPSIRYYLMSLGLIMHVIHSSNVDEDVLSTVASDSFHDHYELTTYPESFCIYSHMQLKNQFLFQLSENLHLKQLTTSKIFSHNLVDIIKTINIWLLWYFLHLLQHFSQCLIFIPHRGFLYFMQLISNTLSSYLDINLDLIEHVGDSMPILRYIAPLNLEELIEFIFAALLGVYLLVGFIFKTVRSGFHYAVQNVSKSIILFYGKSEEEIKATSLDKLPKVKSKKTNKKFNKAISKSNKTTNANATSNTATTKECNQKSIKETMHEHNNSKAYTSSKAHSTSKSTEKTKATNTDSCTSMFCNYFSNISRSLSSSIRCWFSNEEAYKHHIKTLKKASRKNSKKRKNKHRASTCHNDLFDEKLQSDILNSTDENYDSCSSANRKL